MKFILLGCCLALDLDGLSPYSSFTCLISSRNDQYRQLFSDHWESRLRIYRIHLRFQSARDGLV